MIMSCGNWNGRLRESWQNWGWVMSVKPQLPSHLKQQLQQQPQSPCILQAFTTQHTQWQWEAIPILPKHQPPRLKHQHHQQLW